MLGSIFGGLAGAALGLFGQKGDAGNPYFGQMNGALNNEGQQIGQLGGLSGQYGQLAGQAMGSYNQYAPQYNQAVNSYGQYLQQNPFTDSRSAFDIARATSGTAGAYQQAQAQLGSSLGSRGFDPNSSMMAGGLTGLAQNYQTSMNSARNQEAYNAIGVQRQNLSDLTGLYGGAASNYYNMGTAALGQQASLGQMQASDYGSIAGAYGNFGQAQQARTDQYNQSLASGIGGLIGGLGNMAGFGSVLGGGNNNSGNGVDPSLNQADQSWDDSPTPWYSTPYTTDGGNGLNVTPGSVFYNYSPGGSGYSPGGSGYSPGGSGYSPGGSGYSPGVASPPTGQGGGLVNLPGSVFGGYNPGLGTGPLNTMGNLGTTPGNTLGGLIYPQGGGAYDPLNPMGIY